MKVEVYSDITCPWCYIGERRLRRALEASPRTANADVEFRPFQLDPGAPTDARPVSEYLERRFGAVADAMTSRVTQEAAGEGILMDWDRALMANTRDAHRLLMLAGQEYGSAVQIDLAEKLFELHFTRGGDIGSAEQLADAAESAGMDRARALEYLVSSEGERELDEQLAAAQRMGVRAVPTFVIDGRYVVQGAQPASAFIELFERLAPQGDAEADSAVVCVDGACEV